MDLDPNRGALEDGLWLVETGPGGLEYEQMVGYNASKFNLDSDGKTGEGCIHRKVDGKWEDKDCAKPQGALCEYLPGRQRCFSSDSGRKLVCSGHNHDKHHFKLHFLHDNRQCFNNPYYGVQYHGNANSSHYYHRFSDRNHLRHGPEHLSRGYDNSHARRCDDDCMEYLACVAFLVPGYGEWPV